MFAVQRERLREAVEDSVPTVLRLPEPRCLQRQDPPDFRTTTDGGQTNPWVLADADAADSPPDERPGPRLHGAGRGLRGPLQPEQPADAGDNLRALRHVAGVRGPEATATRKPQEMLQKGVGPAQKTIREECAGREEEGVDHHEGHRTQVDARHLRQEQVRQTALHPNQRQTLQGP